MPKDQQSAATDAALRDNVAKGEMPQGKYDDWKRAKGLHVDITAKRRQLAERIADAKTNKEVQNSVKNVDVAITEAVAEKAGGWKDNVVLDTVHKENVTGNADRQTGVVSFGFILGGSGMDAAKNKAKDDFKITAAPNQPAQPKPPTGDDPAPNIPPGGPGNSLG